MTKICFSWIVLGRSWPIVVVVYRYFFILCRIFYFVNYLLVWWYNFVFYLISLFIFLWFFSLLLYFKEAKPFEFLRMVYCYYSLPKSILLLLLFLFVLFVWLVDWFRDRASTCSTNSVIIPIRAYFVIILEPRINRVGAITGEEGKIPDGQ